MVSLHQYNSADPTAPAWPMAHHRTKTKRCREKSRAWPRVFSTGLPRPVAPLPATAVGHGTGHGKHTKNDWKWWFTVDLPMKTHEKWWCSIVFLYVYQNGKDYIYIYVHHTFSRFLKLEFTWWVAGEKSGPLLLCQAHWQLIAQVILVICSPIHYLWLNFIQRLNYNTSPNIWRWSPSEPSVQWRHSAVI